MAGFFDTLFGGGAEREAADKNRALAAQYGTTAQDYLKQGYDTGTTNLNQAVDAWKPLGDIGQQYSGATKLYLDALGVNGPEAAKAAQANFVPSAGYGLSQQAGEDALARRQATTGMFNSGNAQEDLLKFGQNNLYGTQYAPWLANLQGAGQTGANIAGTVASGKAGGYTNLANLGQQFAQNQVGVSGNVLGADTSANTLQASGEASGAKNLLGAGLSLASLALAPMTGGTSLLGMGGNALKNTNIAQNWFGGGSPTGYGRG
jgi:hypothetical protein